MLLSWTENGKGVFGISAFALNQAAHTSYARVWRLTLNRECVFELTMQRARRVSARLVSMTSLREVLG